MAPTFELSYTKTQFTILSADLCFTESKLVTIQATWISDDKLKQNQWERYTKQQVKIFGIWENCVYTCMSFYEQREPVPDDYYKREPEHKVIYRFLRNLFSAAQLTAEYAIVTLVSLPSV